MTVKINTKQLEFGKDFVSVKGTIKMQELLDQKLIKALDASQAMIKATQTEGLDSARELLEAEPKAVNACLDFLQAAFKLNDKEVDRIKDNCTMQAVDLLNFCTNVLAKVKGNENTDTAEAVEKAKQAQAAPKRD